MRKELANNSQPIMNDVLGKAVSALAESDSAKSGKVPDQLEINALFSNMLPKYAKQNAKKLAGMPKADLNKLEVAVDAFRRHAADIMVCSFDQANDQLAKLGKLQVVGAQ